MRSQNNAGCCVALILAILFVPTAWVVLVLTDGHPDYISNQFRQGLGSKQVQELAIWTQWRLRLREEPSADYSEFVFGELLRLVQETIEPDSGGELLDTDTGNPTAVMPDSQEQED